MGSLQTNTSPLKTGPAGRSAGKPARGGSGKDLGVLYKTFVSSALVISLLVVAGIWHLGANSMIACGFLGAWFIHLGSRPSLRQAGLALSAGLAAALVYRLAGGVFGPNAFPYCMGIGAFLGVGSILGMALDRIWTGSAQFTSALRDALILPVFSLVAGLSMQLANSGSHASFDFLLYRFDGSLGLAPGPAVASLFQWHPWIGAGSSLVYAGLLIFPPLYHGWASHRVKTARFHLMHAFVIAGVGGFILYQICPAMGPLYAFGKQFPDHLPAWSAVPVQALIGTGVNNAMPSMHMTWALLVWVASWELGGFAVAIASVFVTFTGLATVGFGEHYLIDLVVSVPLVMMVVGASTFRHKLTVIGLGLVVAWTLYLRTGILLPAALNWLAIVATVATTLVLLRPFLTAKQTVAVPEQTTEVSSSSSAEALSTMAAPRADSPLVLD
jgi:hypothetical protein